jgi:hypothetical protein
MLAFGRVAASADRRGSETSLLSLPLIWLHHRKIWVPLVRGRSTDRLVAEAAFARLLNFGQEFFDLNL